MNRYYQAPRMTQDTTWESDKTQLNTAHKSQKVSPFPAGDHKAAMNRRGSMTNIGTVSKNILLEDLDRFHSAHLTLSSDVDQDT